MNFPPVEEVRLKAAPLEKALCQVGFPQEPLLEDEKAIRGFREALKPAYPVFQPAAVAASMVGPDGSVQQQPASRIWNFVSVDDSWRIILASNWMALETQHRYSSIDELADRMFGALEALNKHLPPPRRDRFGVRYLNALKAGGDVDRLLALVNPALHGVAATDVVNHEQLWVSVGEMRALFEEDGGQMAFKYGLMPPGVPTDITPPFDQRVFLLDFDVFDVRPTEFDPAATIDNLRSFHTWIYRAFRWSLSDAGFSECDPDV